MKVTTVRIELQENKECHWEEGSESSWLSQDILTFSIQKPAKEKSVKSIFKKKKKKTKGKTQDARIYAILENQQQGEYQK